MHAQKLRDSQLNPLHWVKNEKNGEKLQKNRSNTEETVMVKGPGSQS